MAKKSARSNTLLYCQPTAASLPRATEKEAPISRESWRLSVLTASSAIWMRPRIAKSARLGNLGFATNLNGD